MSIVIMFEVIFNQIGNMGDNVVFEPATAFLMGDVARQRYH